MPKGAPALGHRSGKMTECPHCDITCPSEVMLFKHVKDNHPGLKPYACPHGCGATFTGKQAMNKHTDKNVCTGTGSKFQPVQAPRASSSQPVAVAPSQAQYPTLPPQPQTRSRSQSQASSLPLQTQSESLSQTRIEQLRQQFIRRAAPGILGKPSFCAHCDPAGDKPESQFLSELAMMNHVREAHGGDARPFPCMGGCGQWFKQKRSMTLHWESKCKQGPKGKTGAAAPQRQGLQQAPPVVPAVPAALVGGAAQKKRKREEAQEEAQEAPAPPPKKKKQQQQQQKPVGPSVGPSGQKKRKAAAGPEEDAPEAAPPKKKQQQAAPSQSRASSVVAGGVASGQSEAVVFGCPNCNQQFTKKANLARHQKNTCKGRVPVTAAPAVQGVVNEEDWERARMLLAECGVEEGEGDQGEGGRRQQLPPLVSPLGSEVEGLLEAAGEGEKEGEKKEKKEKKREKRKEDPSPPSQQQLLAQQPAENLLARVGRLEAENAVLRQQVLAEKEEKDARVGSLEERLLQLEKVVLQLEKQERAREFVGGLEGGVAPPSEEEGESGEEEEGTVVVEVEVEGSPSPVDQEEWDREWERRNREVRPEEYEEFVDDSDSSEWSEEE
ncbi:hypothetical protein UCDDS831_g08520 [Diplodia seriata]|uniref:C2H2-type domain-containing protein n=1 Tax=Diplodia seriata TaxID=420778 RepID=A0A0G2GA06_9PEZI|nr:hypothetical protein UCDDS831_g08520 [Diplodia seriata]